MSDFQVEVRVVPREGILDPQGKAVAGALKSLGFAGVDHVHVGRLVTLSLTAGSADEADDEGEVRELDYGEIQRRPRIRRRRRPLPPEDAP